MPTVIVADRPPFKDDQDFFNAAVTHLRRQGCKSTRGTQCVYRHGQGSDTLACAIGGVIPDSLMDRILGSSTSANGMPFLGLLREYPEAAQMFVNVTPELGVDLQAVHDDANVWDWEEEFSGIALHRKLTLPLKEAT